MRYVLTILVLVAVVLSGAMAHASMVRAAGEPHVLFQHSHLATGDPAGSAQHRGSAGHVMSEACAKACLGAVALVAPPTEIALVEFNPIVLWTPATPVVRGQMFAPDERPPKSI